MCAHTGVSQSREQLKTDRLDYRFFLETTNEHGQKSQGTTLGERVKFSSKQPSKTVTAAVMALLPSLLYSGLAQGACVEELNKLKPAVGVL